jgi:copper oxidase (laccase) domain-containing protein
VSVGPYASLNLGRKSGDEVERVDENRRIACEAIGADVAKLALNYQVHSDRVLQAAPGARDEHADGLWTDEPGLPILALSADCLPVAIARVGASPRAVAVLHVGWRGLLAGIVEAGACALQDDGLVAAIGPGIGPCCYEVGEEVAAPFRERFGEDVVRDGRLDLWTTCEPETFFSHRRDAGNTGRQGVIAYVTG